MADPHDTEFAEQLSRLTNALQVALGLAAQRATAARAETSEADQLFNAISRAADAARRLRPKNGEEAGS